MILSKDGIARHHAHSILDWRGGGYEPYRMAYLRQLQQGGFGLNFCIIGGQL